MPSATIPRVLLAALLLFGSAVAVQAQIPFKKKGTDEDGAPTGKDPVVAKVNGEPITREQLASELIQMYGKEHLQSMIGRVLVQQQCKAAQVDVTEEDVRKELSQILERNKLKLSEFKQQVLASQDMTLGQYLRDQVWPRLALIRLVKNKVTVTDEDLTKAFEANFGEKVDIRMMTVVERRKAEEVWKQVSDEKTLEDRTKVFEDIARRFSTDEATRPYGGKAAPLGRHTVNEQLEQAAFALQPGDLGSIMQIPGGHLLLLCVGRVPAQTEVTLDSKVPMESPNPDQPEMTYRELLTKDIEQKKVMQEVGVYYKKIEDEAKIENFLTGDFEVDSVAEPSGAPTTVDPTANRRPGASTR
ncbi:peptidylprolyl isomerase [bacterium]|jgi:foldase protein PrsA|nr:peptidylprolyl isomerase [bacterium]